MYFPGSEKQNLHLLSLAGTKYYFMSLLLSISKQLDFNLAYARQLVSDLTESQMTTSPARGLENHPAFTLGHLVIASAMVCEDLGGDYQVPEAWSELFRRKGPGDPRLPNPDGTQYPSKANLLHALEQQHQQIKTLLANITEEKLSKPERWRFHNYLPTLLDATLFMCVNHEAMHLGQLAAWRRAMALPSALAQL